MPDEKPIPSQDAIRAVLQEARAKIEALTFVPEFTIEDYPIGARNRGLCRLGAEWKRGKGWRTVRTTTDKYGNWCKPKHSIYDSRPIGVVTGPGVDRDAAWIRTAMFGDTAIYLQAANGDNTPLLVKPAGLPWSRPRAVEERYTMKITNLHGGEVDRKEYVNAADPPELVEAWAAWEAGLMALMLRVKELADAAQCAPAAV